MKISKYTFLFDIGEEEFFVYNTLSNALMEIDIESYQLLKKIDPDSVSEINEGNFDTELYEALVNQGILTENDDDDFLKFKSIIVKTRGQQEFMHLTIAPTMDCCFNCFYCFEKYKEKNYMSYEVMDSIIEYIAKQKYLLESV